MISISRDAARIVYIVYSVCFGIELCYLLFHAYKLARNKEVRCKKLATISFAIAGACCFILDNASRAAFVYDYTYWGYALCGFPAGIGQNFVCIAYNIIVYAWIRIYYSRTIMRLLVFKVLFVITQIISFILAIVSTFGFCMPSEWGKSTDDVWDTALATAGLRSAIPTVALLISIIVFGGRIIIRLKQSHSIKLHSSNSSEKNTDTLLVKTIINVTLMIMIGSVSIVVIALVAYLLADYYISVDIVQIPLDSAILIFLGAVPFFVKPTVRIETNNPPLSNRLSTHVNLYNV